MTRTNKKCLSGIALTLVLGGIAWGVVAQRCNTAANNYNSYINYTTPCEETGRTVAAVDEVQGPVPIYTYKQGDAECCFNAEIQKEIFKQWASFDGDLPPYKLVLSLWIASSELNPTAVSVTGSLGIPQLSTKTIADCQRKGWYSPERDDLYDPAVQIRLGLMVLNELCVSYPGGDWDYYRAIRAYSIGGTELLKRESEKQFGNEEGYTEAADGVFYPGFYGKVKEIETCLVINAND